MRLIVSVLCHFHFFLLHHFLSPVWAENFLFLMFSWCRYAEFRLLTAFCLFVFPFLYFKIFYIGQLLTSFFIELFLPVNAIQFSLLVVSLG